MRKYGVIPERIEVINARNDAIRLRMRLQYFEKEFGKKDEQLRDYIMNKIERYVAGEKLTAKDFYLECKEEELMGILSDWNSELEAYEFEYDGPLEEFLIITAQRLQAKLNKTAIK